LLVSMKKSLNWGIIKLNFSGLSGLNESLSNTVYRMSKFLQEILHFKKRCHPIV
jgi:hypothetical protein